MTLTPEQLERGLSLAERDRATRWEWGDWAVSVAGPVGEWGKKDGSTDKLRDGLRDLLEKGSLLREDLPSVTQLRDYRYAADAIPPALRERVPSVAVGRKLSTVRDIRERDALIEKLASEHADGIVTENAVRAHFDMAPVGPKAPREVTPEKVVEALADMEPEEIEEVIEALPPKTQAEIVTAAFSQPVPMDGGGVPAAEDPTRYEIDHLLLRAMTPLKEAAERVNTYGVRLMRSNAEARESIDAIAQCVAQIAAALNEERENAA